MPYTVNFTDSENKSPITVFDNTSSTDTSLTFPGRNVTGYGQIIAENFLALLENFASSTEPINPVEGQLWYDSTNGVLQIWDNTAWKAASGIQKGPSEPNIPDSKVGELWVDTTNQQLRIYTGTRWILVGPSESSVDGLRYGPTVERISDSDNITRFILTFYIADIPVIIFSKDSFTPKTIISGFSVIRSGINVATPNTSSEIAQFVGGFLPKLFGTASNADALNIAGVEIPAGRFLRSDTTNTTDFGINVRSNTGITLGVDGTFNISNTATAAKIYNSAAGSSLDLQTNRNGIPATILRVIDNRVGINKDVPDQALDVDGNIGLSGSLIVTNITASTNLSNGSIRTSGGVAITKNLLVGDGIDVTGILQTNTVQPKTTDTFDIGTSLRRWNTVRAKTIVADTIQGVLEGNISGNANTATNLKNVSTFQLAGDVVSPAVQFDGQVGSYTKIFNTTLTANIIAGKNEPFPKVSKQEDQILVYRPSLARSTSVTVTVSSGDFIIGQTYTIEFVGTTNFVLIGATANTVGVSFIATGTGASAGPEVLSRPTPGSGTASTIISSQGLIKENRNTFVGDLGVPIGAIMPYAGANAPYGYLFCDGSEVERTKFSELYDVISTLYNGTAPLTGVGTFRLPDLRGRFGLGKDNMDNGVTVPVSTGGYVDGGGGTAGRVLDTKATILGADAGQSSVTLSLANLPEHSHTLGSARQDYSAIAVTTTIDPDATTGLGPTAPGQAQYLKDSGGIKKPVGLTLGTAIGTMNPYLTVNYIIRSGPPAF
jgi:microcystin-dependent protein